MTLNDIYQLVLDKAGLQGDDRKTENIIKTAINAAYMNFSRLDCSVAVEEYATVSTILDLPPDFLVALKLLHSDLGVIRDDQYKATGSTLVIPKYIADQGGSLTLMYGAKPDLLEADDDEPEINEKYHMGLYYYALHAATGDVQFKYEYNDLLGSVPPFEPFLDEAFEQEIVRDVY